MEGLTIQKANAVVVGVGGGTRDGEVEIIGVTKDGLA